MACLGSLLLGLALAFMAFSLSWGAAFGALCSCLGLPCAFGLRLLRERACNVGTNQRGFALALNKAHVDAYLRPLSLTLSSYVPLYTSLFPDDEAREARLHNRVTYVMPSCSVHYLSQL